MGYHISRAKNNFLLSDLHFHGIKLVAPFATTPVVTNTRTRNLRQSGAKTNNFPGPFECNRLKPSVLVLLLPSSGSPTLTGSSSGFYESHLSNYDSDNANGVSKSTDFAPSAPAMQMPTALQQPYFRIINPRRRAHLDQ